MQLTHINKKGQARMVDITSKKPTRRLAVACGYLTTTPQVINLIQGNRLAKGDVFGVARIAGINAAKQTSLLIPLCHPLAVTNVRIDINVVGKNRIAVRSEVSCFGKSGPDMEALTAAAVTCLTIYDMCKSADKAMRIERLYLTKKTGGKSGTYEKR